MKYEYQSKRSILRIVVAIAFVIAIFSTLFYCYIHNLNEFLKLTHSTVLAQPLINKTITTFILLTVLFAVVIVYLILSNSHTQKKLYAFAFTDPVTRKGNWNLFEKEVVSLIERHRQTNYAVVQIDIDKFSLMNDMFGYETGDKLLYFVADTLAKNISSKETFCRIAADNFCLLLEYISDQQLIDRMNFFYRQINLLNNIIPEPYYMGFSAGVYRLQDRSEKPALMNDRAKIARKRGLESQDTHIVFYDPTTRDTLVKEKLLENQMYNALKTNQFEVYLQPKYELLHNCIVGAEALVRWNHPIAGMLSPGEFIPFFEQNGFVTKLDFYVFENVCALMRSWQDNQLSPMPIAINFSRLHLDKPDFTVHLQEIIRKYDISPSLLVIELTENTFLNNIDTALSVIFRLKSLGFTVSMDDFGSGFSSLNLLKQIPVDELKLDRGFFCDTIHEQRGESIVESVINMAKKLNMSTVSEGIEETAQVDFLKKIGCDIVQGYVFAKPMPVAEFEALAFASEPCFAEKVTK